MSKSETGSSFVDGTYFGKDEYGDYYAKVRSASVVGGQVSAVLGSRHYVSRAEGVAAIKSDPREIVDSAVHFAAPGDMSDKW